MLLPVWIKASVMIVCKHVMSWFFVQITPLRGPREGGTLVTIRGENLGLNFHEIEGNVKVADVDCTPVPEGYIPAEQ